MKHIPHSVIIIFLILLSFLFEIEWWKYTVLSLMLWLDNWYNRIVSEFYLWAPVGNNPLVTKGGGNNHEAFPILWPNPSLYPSAKCRSRYGCLYKAGWPFCSFTCLVRIPQLSFNLPMHISLFALLRKVPRLGFSNQERKRFRRHLKSLWYSFLLYSPE